MTLTKSAFALACACLVCTGSAMGQTLVQPAPDYRLTFYENVTQDEDSQASPSDIVEPIAVDTTKLAKDDVFSSQKGKGAACCFTPMCAGDPWKLFPLECSPWDMGGHFQLGYHTAGKNGNGTGLFNNYPNRIQLQQAWFYAEKAIDNGGCGFDWGFRFDIAYGTDGPDTQAFGGPADSWDNPWDYGEAYGLAIPQLYAEVAYNNLSAKVGHFYTIAGYEVVPATGNFFYSHANTMYQAEPFTHTGILAQYAMGDRVTLYGGWTQGWDTGFENNGGSSFLGGFGVDVTDNITATYTTTMGDPGFGGSDPDSYSHSAILDMQLTDRLNYVIMGDYVDSAGLFNGDPLNWDKKWSVVNYLFYDITDCVAAGVRYEYFESESYGSPAPHVNAYTAGLNIRPHANVILRPEVRYDDYGPGYTVGNATLQDSTMLAIDAIFTY